MTSAETPLLPGSDGTYAVFVHLNAEKSPLYRAILRAFVAERARCALALRPSEIQAALATTSGPALPTDEVEAALRQLCDWGNLDDSPDTAEAASVEEFYRKRRLYQLSAAGEAAEQALTVFDEYLHRPGELQTTALHDIIELLDALPPLLANEPPDDAKLHLTLSSLVAMAGFPTIKATPRKVPITLTAQESQTLLDEPARNTIIGLRDRALLALLCGTGIRASECATLRQRQLDLQALTITVSGKGGHQRTIPLNENLAAVLSVYCQARGPAPLDAPVLD
jgi:integrase